jgi:hypothetical protein
LNPADEVAELMDGIRTLALMVKDTRHIHHDRMEWTRSVLHYFMLMELTFERAAELAPDDTNIAKGLGKAHDAVAWANESYGREVTMMRVKRDDDSQ